MFGLISKREHDAVVAAKDADADAFKQARDAWYGQWQRANAQCAAHEHTIAELRARLNLYEGPRARNEKGQYRSTKVPA